MAKKRSKKEAEIKVEKIDGLNPKDRKQIVRKLREIWSWSYPKKLCLARAVSKDGFSVCEKCKKKVPKVFADHIVPVGEFDSGIVERMWVPSTGLQALCKKCHDAKTYIDNGNLDFR